MRLPRLVLPLLGLLAAAAPAPACSIPVFRYALERWAPAPCELTVFRRGPLAAADAELLRPLEPAVGDGQVTLVDADLDGPLDAEVRRRWRAQPPGAAPPWLVVRTAQAAPKDADAWHGPLTADNLAAVLDSPARRRLAERLTHGDAAVFVLLEDDDPAAADRAAALLKGELARLEGAIALPERTEEGPQLLSPQPLRVRFGSLRLSRRDAAERGLVGLLLSSEPGLEEARGPIVFPVFGRGRALCALHGEELSAKQLERVGRFLCGACSCQVKELNPGIDLLIRADWARLLDLKPEEEPVPSAPPEPARPDRAPGKGVVPASPPLARASAPPAPPRNLLVVGIALASMCVLLAAVWLVRSLRTGRPG